LGGENFWARGYFCVTSGQVTEEMIKAYLEHHFELNPNDEFRTEPKRVLDPYPDFQSVIRNKGMVIFAEPLKRANSLKMVIMSIQGTMNSDSQGDFTTKKNDEGTCVISCMTTISVTCLISIPYDSFPR
jgi:hypothetical protein